MTMPYLHDVFAAAVHYGCRVDWIRLVNNMADHGVQPTVTSLQYRLWELAGKGQRGETWKPWRCDKYVGWTTGQWSIGWHGLDYMVEVRSEPAHQAWIDYAKSFSRCTRLDVAYDLAIDVNGDCLADVMKYWFHKSKVYRRRSNLDPIDYELREGDEIFAFHDASLVVNAQSLAFLDGSRVDFVREGLNASFRLDNPNVDNTCGCGESFSLKEPARV